MGQICVIFNKNFENKGKIFRNCLENLQKSLHFENPVTRFLRVVSHLKCMYCIDLNEMTGARVGRAFFLILFLNAWMQILNRIVTLIVYEKKII